MNRVIEKTVKRFKLKHITCKDAIELVRHNYGQFGVEIFKQLVRLEKEKSKNNKINNLSLVIS